MREICLCLALACLCGSLQGLTVSKEDMSLIASRIYKNECGSKPENLVHWNEGEEFISLGIGHFIWYPANKKGPFEEQFPRFIQFCKQQKIPLGHFLEENTSCPWATRAAFLEDKNSQSIIDLRKFLLDTRTLQASFIAQRVQESLTKITQSLPDTQKEPVITRFNKLAASVEGLYALIDYVNFKGEGVNVSERYNNQGWGLLQVLQEMNNDTLESFKQSAKTLLSRRVTNSPPERNEQRWLQGWHNRIDTYGK